MVFAIEEIQAKLKLRNTQGLNELMDHTLLIEEKNVAMKKGKELAK